MRQSRLYGSVRGVRGNLHPYRDIVFRRLLGRAYGPRKFMKNVQNGKGGAARLWKAVEKSRLIACLIRSTRA